MFPFSYYANDCMMKYDTENDMLQLAIQLVNQSNRNIFLTGKAGTGKTTFLKHIREIALGVGGSGTNRCGSHKCWWCYDPLFLLTTTCAIYSGNKMEQDFKTATRKRP
ncbi:MAG: hypothetical protein IPK57_15685 [Chitinophagaceae bacterium]|nr:hypothetical protein [Chitinophagaceae bacterium]